jgi:hypothetical protein
LHTSCPSPPLEWEGWGDSTVIVATIEPVIAVTADQGVIVNITNECVITLAANQEVVTGFAVESVITCASSFFPYYASGYPVSQTQPVQSSQNR